MGICLWPTVTSVQQVSVYQKKIDIGSYQVILPRRHHIAKLSLRQCRVSEKFELVKIAIANLVVCVLEFDIQIARR